MQSEQGCGKAESNGSPKEGTTIFYITINKNRVGWEGAKSSDMDVDPRMGNQARQWFLQDAAHGTRKGKQDDVADRGAVPGRAPGHRNKLVLQQGRQSTAPTQ